MKRTLTVILLVLTVAWGTFIFANSLDSGLDSSKKSGAVHALVNGVAAALGATEEIPEATVRTWAHFGEFAVLGVLFTADLVCLLPLSPRDPLSRRHFLLFLSLPAAMLFAVIDEIIQYFTPGRAMQLTDMLVDSAGALCGMLFLLAILFCVRMLQRQRQRIS